MHYLYHIENQINGKIYVGKSMERRDSRWLEHKIDARSGRTKMPIHRAMNKYGEENFSYNVISMYNTQEEALLAEVDLIAYLREQGVVLYNVADGGNGWMSGKKRGPRSAEHQKNAHKFPKGNIPVNKGTEMSLETRNKVSKNAAGRKISDLQRQEIKDLYATGKYSHREIGLLYSISQGHITNIINGKTGYISRKSLLPKKSKISIKRKNMTDEIIRSYKTGNYTQTELAKMYQLHRKTIGSIIKGKKVSMNNERQG